MARPSSLLTCPLTRSCLPLDPQPDWTTWALLALIACYDLVAVLWSKGPLRMLVNLAQERDEPLFPALIYSSTMVWIVSMADINGEPRAKLADKKKTDEATAADSEARDVASFAPSAAAPAAQPAQPARRGPSAAQEEEPEEGEDEEASGVKLGLGDFIFYSVLVGKAATSDDWTTIISCYIGILIVRARARCPRCKRSPSAHCGLVGFCNISSLSRVTPSFGTISPSHPFCPPLPRRVWPARCCCCPSTRRLFQPFQFPSSLASRSSSLSRTLCSR